MDKRMIDMTKGMNLRTMKLKTALQTNQAIKLMNEWVDESAIELRYSQMSGCASVYLARFFARQGK